MGLKRPSTLAYIKLTNLKIRKMKNPKVKILILYILVLVCAEVVFLNDGMWNLFIVPAVVSTVGIISLLSDGRVRKS